MDSLTQLVLGAAVGVAVMRRRTAAWKAALWGGVAGTLPDLDVLLSHGNPVLDMVLHRAETHAIFWLTLFSAPFAWMVSRLHGQGALFKRWWLALWLALVTHPLLDWLTVYGTQLALPFSNHPFGVGSVFIIDPLVTLPWLLGMVWALAARGSAAGLRANAVGLVLGVAYLGLGVVLQQQVLQQARGALAAQGIQPERLLATPSPFNTVLWRVVAVQGDAVHEGFYSFLDRPGAMHFDRFDRGLALAQALAANDNVQRIQDFSRGLWKMHEDAGRIIISDLRMGQEPGYVFAFAVAERHSPPRPLDMPLAVGGQADPATALPWLWRRLQGQALPPPR